VVGVAEHGEQRVLAGRLPIESPSPTARALWSVAWWRAWRAVSQRGSPVVDFWMRAVRAIASHTSSELFEAAPSVARPTSILISRRARTGVVVGQPNLR
jgi:hypothetical protein